MGKRKQQTAPPVRSWAIRVYDRAEGRSYFLRGADWPVATYPTRQRAGESLSLLKRMGYSGIKPKVVRVEVREVP